MGASGSFSKKLKRLFHHLCSFGESDLELLNSQIQKHLILNYSNSFFIINNYRGSFIDDSIAKQHVTVIRRLCLLVFQIKCVS